MGNGTGQELGAKSFIVLHRKAIGEKSPWMLTRLGVDGVRHWTTEIALTELDHVSDGGSGSR